MNRREFSIDLATAGLALAASPLAWAQGGPVEGQQYTRMSQPVAVTAAAGKVEVLEFFWYGCPHCNALEPTLEEWVKKLPADVAFRRVPVGFAAIHETHQKIFYALESMGQLPALHRKVFAAIHVNHARLDKEADIVAFMAANGVDGAKFGEAFKSFTVQTKARQAKLLAEAYKIDGVPTLAVGGRYITSGSQAGTNEQALHVVEFLVQRSRKAA